MKKICKKKGKAAISVRKASKGTTKAAEYVSCLLELHKLQGALLARLDKGI